VRFLCLCFLLAAAGQCRAQAVNPQDEAFALAQRGTMPAWIVPVLRLVSATHVEPTTGIVLSSSGLVLVPEDFAAPGDEIIVLDGGTDIFRNGRPARLEMSFPAEGLDVLRVQGLNRNGAPFASLPLEDQSQVQLTAFPPAELIAQGEPPLKIPATVVVFKENGMPSLSGETPLPNVTGPLLDSCGNLAGVSLAYELQSMDPSPSTLYQWRTTLLRLLGELQITARGSACPQAAAVAEPEAEPEPVIEKSPVEIIPPPEAIEEKPEEVQDSAPEEAEEESAATEPEDTAEVIEEQLPELEILPPYEKDSMEDSLPDEAPEEEPSASGWWWLLGAAALFVLGFIVHRWRRESSRNALQGTDDEPEEPGPGSVVQEEGPGWAEPAMDSLLFIRGALANGSAFEASCEVSANAINLVIGRGDADLRIDSTAVSRQHARLNGTAQSLTLSDLGSNNGTSINGVPCLEDEILYVEPGDTVILGDARFNIEIRPAGEKAE